MAIAPNPSTGTAGPHRWGGGWPGGARAAIPRGGGQPPERDRLDRGAYTDEGGLVEAPGERPDEPALHARRDDADEREDDAGVERRHTEEVLVKEPEGLV